MEYGSRLIKAERYIGVEISRSRFPQTQAIEDRERPYAPILLSCLEKTTTALFNNGADVIVLLGLSGTGKTVLARQALDRATSEGWMIGSGRYDDVEHHQAIGPIIDALSMLVEDALGRLYDPQAGIASLTEKLGLDLDVLVSAGLRATGLPTTTSLVALAESVGGMRRITAAVLRLLRWTETFGVRRVVLIDDWWRAPASAIALIREIAGHGDQYPVKLLLTQRDRSSQALEASDHVVEVGALSDAESVSLLSARFGFADPDFAKRVLSEIDPLLPHLTFDLLQAADALVTGRAVYRDGDEWRFDPATARNLAFHAETRLAKLDADSRQVVAALSLWGRSAPLADLRQALGGLLPDTSLEQACDALERHGIADRDAAYLTFHHDRFKQAALSLLPSGARRELAYAMAQAFPARHGSTDVELAVLEIKLAGGLDRPDPDRWLGRFARGAAEARGRGNADAANRFAEAAFDLLERCADIDRDERRLALREGVYAAADRHDPQTEQRARALIASARSNVEVCHDFETGIVAMRLAAPPDAAWRFACEGLRAIGIAPPGDRPWLSFVWAALRWRWSQGSFSGVFADRNIVPLDLLAGVAANAAMIAYHRDPASTALIAFRGSRVAGSAARESPYWQSIDAFLFSAMGDPKRAMETGVQALANLPRQQTLRASTLYQALFFGALWGRPLKGERDRFREIVPLALREGDRITACYGWRIFVMAGWRTHPDLDSVRRDATLALDELRKLGEMSFIEEMTAMLAMLDGLTGRAPWEPGAWRDDLPTRNHVIDLELSNLAGDWPETLRRAKRIRPLMRDYDVQVDSVVLRFHESIARFRCGLPMRRSSLRILRRAAALNPADHKPKLLLIEAERLRRRGAKTEAVLVAFATAVKTAAAADSRLDAAMAAICAGEYAASLGEAALCDGYFGQAQAIYADWGVRAAIASTQTPSAARVAEADARAEAAERAERAKSRLLQHVAHEMGTPLQALRGILDMKSAGFEVDFDSIRAVLGSLTSVVDDLAIAEGLAEQGNANAATPVDMAALLRSEIAILPADAEVQIVIDGPQYPVDIAADRVRQVVRNLLSNAIKYGGGTPIDVELTMAAGAGGATDIVIAVQDRGPGLVAADLDRLFEPFERGAFAHDGRGDGLGLAISRRIADRLGAVLGAANRTDGGARFEFAFKAPRSVSDKLLHRARAATILLAEDIHLVRSLVATLLRRSGHHVIAASTAAEALTAWRNEPIDLAILDIGLPDRSGLSVLAEIRAAETSNALPVILLTASADDDAAHAARGPATRLLRKPASIEALDATIVALLGCVPAQAARRDDQDESVAQLCRLARATVDREARGFLSEMPAPDKAHQLAGLAAQFGWIAVAAAVERLSAAACDDAAIAAARAALALAIGGMA